MSFPSVTKPPTGPLLVVAPHLDDAALSCAALVQRRSPLDVLTVFAGAPDPPRQGVWDRRCGFATSAESLPARRAEERAAFADTPHRLTFMDLLEAQYVSGPRARADADAIVAEVARWLARFPSGTVAVPAGSGRRRSPGASFERRILRRYRPTQNADHLFVRDTVTEAVAGRGGTALVLYEDLPYLLGRRADAEVEGLARRLGVSASPFRLSIDRAAKARRIAAYATQVPHLLAPGGLRLDDAAALEPEERYWSLRRND